MGATARRALAGVVLLAGLSGCTAEEDPPEQETTQAALEIELAEDGAGLSRADREALQGQVGDVLSSYVVSAFLGDYPRDDFVDSLESFTSGAAEDAAQDLELLTARRYRDADGVVATRLRARVSVFAADDRAAGATAQVRFRFAVRREGEDPTEFDLRGRLALVPDDGEWRIFGYDVTRDDPDAGATS